MPVGNSCFCYTFFTDHVALITWLLIIVRLVISHLMQDVIATTNYNLVCSLNQLA
jgi:hypothetical protein